MTCNVHNDVYMCESVGGGGVNVGRESWEESLQLNPVNPLSMS